MNKKIMFSLLKHWINSLNKNGQSPKIAGDKYGTKQNKTNMKQWEKKLNIRLEQEHNDDGDVVDDNDDDW